MNQRLRPECHTEASSLHTRSEQTWPSLICPHVTIPHHSGKEPGETDDERDRDDGPARTMSSSQSGLSDNRLE
jgi:hypothetical protein